MRAAAHGLDVVAGKRAFAWVFCLCRLARDDERLPAFPTGRHVVAVARLTLHRFTRLL
jgi:hypothetical protein